MSLNTIRNWRTTRLEYVRYAKPTSLGFVSSKQQGSFCYSNIRHGRTREVIVDRPRIVLAFDQSHKRTVVVPLPAIIWTRVCSSEASTNLGRLQSAIC